MDDINVAWFIEHPQYFNQSVLQGSPYDSETRFVPVKSSDSLYTLRATYTDANLSAPLYATIDISVTNGELTDVSFIIPTELKQSITADDNIEFIPQLTDRDGNIIDSSIITYTRWKHVDDDGDGELDTFTEPVNVTQEILDNGGIWEASTVGNYAIIAWALSESGYNITGAKVRLKFQLMLVNQFQSPSKFLLIPQKLGDVYSIETIATDSDGNTFHTSRYLVQKWNTRCR